MSVPALHPNDIGDEMVSLRGELADMKLIAKSSEELIAAQSEIILDQAAQLSAANKIIADQNAMLATVHAALIAGDVEYAIEFIVGSAKAERQP